MDSPQLGAKQRAALPSHLLHGTSQLSNGNLSRRTSVGVKEREKLIASIQSSNRGRRPIDLTILDEPLANGHEPHSPEPTLQPTEPQIKSIKVGVAARDPRDTALESPDAIAARPASPFTASPTIDFDGLSWPSES